MEGLCVIVQLTGEVVLTVETQNFDTVALGANTAQSKENSDF